MDPRHTHAGDYVVADVERLLLLGLACSHPTPAEWPKIEAIVQIISRAIDPPTVPPFRPVFVWPMVGPLDEVEEEEGEPESEKVD